MESAFISLLLLITSDYLAYVRMSAGRAQGPGFEPGLFHDAHDVLTVSVSRRLFTKVKVSSVLHRARFLDLMRLTSIAQLEFDAIDLSV